MSTLQISNPYTGQPHQTLKEEQWNRDWEVLKELKITPKQIADRMQSLLDRVTQEKWQTIDRVSVQDAGVREMRSSICPFGCTVEGEGPGEISFKNLSTHEEFSVLSEQIHVIRQHADFHLKAGMTIQEVHLNPELVVSVLKVEPGKSYETKTQIVEEVFWKWMGVKTEKTSTLEDGPNSLAQRYGHQEVGQSHYASLHGRSCLFFNNRTIMHIVSIPKRKEAQQFLSIPVELEKIEESTIQIFHKASRNVIEKEFSDGSKRRRIESNDFVDLSQPPQKKIKMDPDPEK